jgi:hypothetical protein
MAKAGRAPLGRTRLIFMPGRFDDPEHWRGRAEEARTLGEQLTDAVSRRTLLRIAEEYDLLAEHAQRRAEKLARN